MALKLQRFKFNIQKHFLLLAMYSTLEILQMIRNVNLYSFILIFFYF